MALRFDKTILNDPKLDQNGYLVASARATRTGVFVYHHPDGSTTRELRHPDDVFRPDSIKSLKNRPITHGHPPEGKVNSKNTKRLAVGMAIDTPRRDDIYLDTDIQITDEDVIKRILDDEKPLRGLSCGYEADVIKEDGTYQGEEYDHRQTKIKYNHIALVNRGRAGPQVRLQLDEEDAAGDGLEDIVKTDVEETEENIHIPVRGSGQFKEGSFKTTPLKGATGVQLVIGRLKTPPKGEEGSAVAQKFIFSKKHFTMAQANAFMKKHKGDEAELVKTGKIDQTTNRSKSKFKEDNDMLKINRQAVDIRSFKLDAYELEIDDTINSGRKAVETVIGKLDSAIEHINKLEGEKDKMQGKIDALKDQGKISLATLNDQVKERTDAVSAAHYLGMNDYMDMETEDLKKAIVCKAYPQVKIDELTKDHIEGRYDTIIEGMRIEGDNLKNILSLKPKQGDGKNSRFPVRGDEGGPRDQFLESTKDMYLSDADKKLQA